MDALLEAKIFVCKEKLGHEESRFCSEKNTGIGNSNSSKAYLCFQYNNRIECLQPCKYCHVYSICSKNYLQKSCPCLSRPQNRDRTTENRFGTGNPNFILQDQKEWLSNPFNYIAKSFPYKLTDNLELLDQRKLLQIDGWRHHLQAHPDKVYIQTILDIITYGAKIGYTGPDQFIISKNLISANNALDILTADLEQQISHHCLLQVKTLPSKFICSPLGFAPKLDNTWRHIHHLSHLEDIFVNDYIPEE